MSVPDTRPDVTSTVRQQLHLVTLQTEAIATGMLPASTALFRELCALSHATERLRHVCELELSLRIAEIAAVAATGEEVPS